MPTIKANTAEIIWDFLSTIITPKSDIAKESWDIWLGAMSIGVPKLYRRYTGADIDEVNRTFLSLLLTAPIYISIFIRNFSPVEQLREEIPALDSLIYAQDRLQTILNQVPAFMAFLSTPEAKQLKDDYLVSLRNYTYRDKTNLLAAFSLESQIETHDLTWRLLTPGEDFMYDDVVSNELLLSRQRLNSSHSEILRASDFNERANLVLMSMDAADPLELRLSNHGSDSFIDDDDDELLAFSGVLGAPNIDIGFVSIIEEEARLVRNKVTSTDQGISPDGVNQNGLGSCIPWMNRFFSRTPQVWPSELLDSLDESVNYSL